MQLGPRARADDEASSREQGRQAHDRDAGDPKAYVGIRHDPRSKRTDPYYAHIKWQGPKYQLGYLPDAVSATKAYDWAARLVGNRRQLNFGCEVDLGLPPASDDAASLRARVSQMGGTAAVERAADARYRGICTGANAPATMPFKAQIRRRGTTCFLGSYPDARPAAKAYDWAARLIDNGRLLNFDASEDLGAQPTSDGATRLRKDVAKAARSLGRGAGASSAQPMPLLPPALASHVVPPQQRPPSPAAGAAAKRAARAAPPATTPPAAKQRHSPSGPQPTPLDADALVRTESSLASQLRVLLRLRGLREDDLALDELGEGALRDITADVRGAGPAAGEGSQGAGAGLGGYLALDLQARLAVYMRLRAISEDGLRLDLLTDEVGRGLLHDLLRTRGQNGGSA